MLKEDIIALAELAHARQPQYQNYWRGPEWRMVRVRRRDIHTKEGKAFIRGDVTIARPHSLESRDWEAYSIRNGANVVVSGVDILELLDLQELARFRDKVMALAIDLDARATVVTMATQQFNPHVVKLATALKHAVCDLVLDNGDGRGAACALREMEAMRDNLHVGPLVEDLVLELKALLA
jgi:alpha-D-ribose 1-methylphosphonate 5-triphosphate synthase subunit PhnG